MRRSTLGAVVVLVLAVAGCGGDPGEKVTARPVPASSVPGQSASGVPGRPVPPSPSPSSGQEGRSAEVERYLAGVSGTVGLVVRDTTTGTSWQAGDPTHAAWTASTIKLAIATSLLEDKVTADRDTMRRMIVNSDNDATDALWEKYDGVGMITRFQQRYGMSTLKVVDGYRPYWRHLQCSAGDLAAVMGYALAELPAPDRAQLVTWLKAAAGVQRWGVWAAGPDAGHKAGWAFKPEGRPDHWVVHSVGFAGPGERYIVAVTYDLPKGGTVKQGAQTVSDVVSLAFGRPKQQVKGP